MNRTKGMGPEEVISDVMAATSSGCPVVTSNSSYPTDNKQEKTPPADG